MERCDRTRGVIGTVKIARGLAKPQLCLVLRKRRPTAPVEHLANGDSRFLRSMIPHHAGAILMCEKARVDDPEIKKLCAGIIRSRTTGIVQMKARLAQLE